MKRTKGIMKPAVGAVALLCGCVQAFVWVEEEVAPSFDHKSIRTIAVVEFANRSSHHDAGRIAADRIEELLVNESPYTVVTRMELNRIIEELKLSVDDRIDSKTINKLGRVAGVDALVLGTVEVYQLEEARLKPLKVARRASVFLSIKAVDTTIGQVVWSRRVSGSFLWRGWTDTRSAVGPRQCLQKALDDALAEARSLFPHKEKIRKRVER